MQREPMLASCSEREGGFPFRAVQPAATSETGPMTGIKDIRRVGVTLIGVAFLFVAIFAGTYAVAHQLHQDHAGNVLLASQKANTEKVKASDHGAACTLADPKEGQLSGILSIPAINLQAPVEEGTDDQELNVAVGHDPRRSGPGSTGRQCSWPTT